MALEEVSVQRIGAGGFGIGTLPTGKVVFLPRTAPGDRVRIRVVKEKSRWARGEVVERLQDGPSRRAAPCPLYSKCDGCALQHLEYEEQLRWKGRLVGDALRRLGGVDSEDPGVAPSPTEFGYRNRVTFTLRRLPGGRIVAGLRELGHRGRVLDIGSQCLLPEDPIRTVWTEMRGEWGRGASHLPGGRELRLSLQNGVGGVSLLVRGGRGKGRPEDLLDRVGGLLSVWHERKGEAPELLAGEPTLEVAWGEGTLALAGGGFVQVNTGLGPALYEHVLAEMGKVEGLKIVDAYCGPGILGKVMARLGASVTGIDVAPVVDPWDREEGSSRFRQIVGRVEDEIGRLLPADVVLLNPPRRGLEPSIPVALEKSPVRTIVYVSCDPATLARDLQRLAGNYRVTQVRSFDLFPQTGHIETVATLKKLANERP